MYRLVEVMDLGKTVLVFLHRADGNSVKFIVRKDRVDAVEVIKLDFTQDNVPDDEKEVLHCRIIVHGISNTFNRFIVTKDQAQALEQYIFSET
jgi:arginine/ornithine N-succinyltransferase beta subunit